jgi:hypothetical protein
MLYLVRCFKILLCIIVSNIFENDVKSNTLHTSETTQCFISKNQLAVADYCKVHMEKKAQFFMLNLTGCIATTGL